MPVRSLIDILAPFARIARQVPVAESLDGVAGSKGFEPATAPSGPGWADGNEHDPGITLLELFSYLAVALLLGAIWWRRRRRGSE